jgi:hypothetical protein
MLLAGLTIAFSLLLARTLYPERPEAPPMSQVTTRTARTLELRATPAIPGGST